MAGRANQKGYIISLVDPKFSVPIREMGNYQEFLMKQRNLRKLDTSTDTDKPYFGNPFVKLKACVKYHFQDSPAKKTRF